MDFPFFTLTNIALGITGTVLGTFPSAYLRTIGRTSKLEKADRTLKNLLEVNEVTDATEIHDLLNFLNISDPAIKKLNADFSWKFSSLDDRAILLSDSEGIRKPEQLNAGEITRRIDDTRERDRIRAAFGLILCGYLVQIVGLWQGRS